MTEHHSQHKLTSDQLQQLKSQLQEEQTWLEEHLQGGEHFGLGDSVRVQTGELSTNDNHPADMGTEMFERSKDIALLENAERHLTGVNEALERMDAGDYGTCRTCGTSISFERLQAIPTTMYCVEHVPHPAPEPLERPVEEQFLNPPFGRTSLDDQPDQNGFDGEDAWQILESYGSSTSPAYAENPNESDSYNEIEIEADENVGFVESYESFVATDLYGHAVTVVRNGAYREYMRNGEGYGLLEPETSVEDSYE
ncbi:MULTISPECIES: TraR/DksA C4-type zinc finger protein [Paenibacillus]|uniref:TraR/DksA C4-type zinc finger protein n=1 Tax=Paenibacillus TaxID=44249 RepID=UPI0022B8A0FC|nr:TraR/DksA C4-type zinc finger protein [Paenibacillus caseinilyticus]MCZ8518794.1 TraR/DksA C4-type zinc finger protein [Paenibacillus caseinilyticus]